MEKGILNSSADKKENKSFGSSSAKKKKRKQAVTMHIRSFLPKGRNDAYAGTLWASKKQKKMALKINVPFEELDLPENLYKYRLAHKEEHLRIITHQEFYFAPPLPFSNHEFNLPTDYESITKEDIFKKLYEDSLNIFKIQNEKKRKQFAEYHLKTTNFFDKKFRTKADELFRDRINEEFGIISMSPLKDNCSLWRDFTNFHSGFAVGLKPSFMFKKGIVACTAGFVDYYKMEEQPKMKAFSKSLKEKLSNQMLNIFSLPDKFKDEQEYRLCKQTKISGRILIANKECFSEFILGAFMDKENRVKLIELINSNFKEIPIFEQVINSSNCEMSFNKIQ